MRILLHALVAGTVLVAAGDASAQARRRGYAPAPAYGSGYSAPVYPGRGLPQYSTAPGHSGIIRWNTPNADGNLGSPSTGGGSGNGV